MPSNSQKSHGRRPGRAAVPRPRPRDDKSDAHQGATEAQVGQRAGSGAGYDLEPKNERRKGGVES